MKRSLLNAYSGMRPAIPHAVQIWLRRRWARRRARVCRQFWPIDEAAAAKPKGWRGWPDGKSFALALTHERAGADVCVLRHGYFPADCRVYKEVRALLDAGLTVDVICLRGPGDRLREQWEGVRILRLPYSHRRSSTLRYVIQYGLSIVMMFAVVSWRSLRCRYACVQVNTMPDALVFASILARLRGARVLLDMHEPMPELFITKYGGNRLRGIVRIQVMLEQAAMRYADRVLTVNETIRLRFIERGADGAKISIVRNVPDEEFGHGVVPRRSRQGFVLVTHGTLQPRYGHDVIVRALPLLRGSIEGLRVRVFGSGETDEGLRRLAQDTGCGDLITFEGQVPYSEMADRLSGADVGLVPLMPSPFSDLCQPNKLFEYVALRKPVVVARFPAVEESFDDSCLAYFKPGDPDDLARRVLEIYRMPDRGSGLADNAYRRYEKLRWGVAKEAYVQTVCELVRGGR